MKSIANSAAETGWRRGPCWCGDPVQGGIVDSGSALPNPIASCCNSDNRCLAAKAGASRKRAVGEDGWPMPLSGDPVPRTAGTEGEGGQFSSARGLCNRFGGSTRIPAKLAPGVKIVNEWSAGRLESRLTSLVSALRPVAA